MDLATYWGFMISRFYHNEWQNFWKKMVNKYDFTMRRAQIHGLFLPPMFH